MHDLNESHGCGLAMWQKPIEQVAKELDSKIHDAQWLKKASKAAMKLAEENFDRDVLAMQLLSVLQETAQGHPEKAESIAPGRYD